MNIFVERIPEVCPVFDVCSERMRVLRCSPVATYDVNDELPYHIWIVKSRLKAVRAILKDSAMLFDAANIGLSFWIEATSRELLFLTRE